MTEKFSYLSFIGGALVGTLLAGAWFFTYGGFTLPSPAPTPAPLASGTVSIADTSDAVSVTAQSAGSVVMIDSVTVPPPGVWAAVREMQGDTLGNVLGAVRVAGPRSDVSVPLLRATLPGKSYAVELYRDDAGGAFDVATNSVYIDFSTGAPVIVRFITKQ